MFLSHPKKEGALDNRQNPYDYRARPGAHTKKKRRRRLKRSVRRALVLMCAVVVLLGMATGITVLIQNLSGPAVLPPESGGQPQSQPQASQSVPQDGVDVSTGRPGDTGIDDSAWNYVGPAPQNVAQMSLTSPDYRMIALPANGRVDMSYFDDVTFVGDSITQGMELYGTIPNAKYAAYKGIGPKQIYDGTVQTHYNGDQDVPMEFLVASAPKKVYVLMGTNTMVSFNDDDLLAYYDEMLNQIMLNLPGVQIYVQSITPVIPGVDSRMSNERINGLNDRIAKMAWEKGLYFVNLQEALADENGGLRTEYGAAKDGYHMTGQGTRAWLEYLITHTAYHPDNPYLEGSGYYQQLLPEGA